MLQIQRLLAGQFTGLRGAAWRWRHVFLAVGIAAAILTLADALSPERGEPTIVLASDAAAGQVISAADLRLANFTPGIPGAISEVDAVAGRTLAVGLQAGSPVTNTMLVGAGLGDSAPVGTTVVTVELADPGSAELARPGAWIALVGASATSEGQVLTNYALVLSKIQGQEGGGLLGGGENSTFLVVAVPSESAALVLESSARSPLRVALSRN